MDRSLRFWIAFIQPLDWELSAEECENYFSQDLLEKTLDGQWSGYILAFIQMQ